MTAWKKSSPDLTVADVAEFPVRRFTDSNPDDECEIQPVLQPNPKYLGGRIIAAEVEFADGSKHLALHQNVSFEEPEMNDHFLSLTVNRGGKWFGLARYHDIEIKRYGPKQLAKFMGKKVADIFPIQYDLRAVLETNSPKLVGAVREIPVSPLTRRELISLAVLGKSGGKKRSPLGTSVIKKCFEDLTVSDVAERPIWKFSNSNLEDELEVESVSDPSCEEPDHLIVAAEVEFADGTKHLALHHHVSRKGPVVNDHFVALTISRGAEWFDLARYYEEHAIDRYGPKQLAKFMGKEVADIFPIRYDLRDVLGSDSPGLTGVVREVPFSPLTQEEIMTLIFNSMD